MIEQRALEIECIRLALYHWNQGPVPGRLVLNISVTTLVQVLAQMDIDGILSSAAHGGPADHAEKLQTLRALQQVSQTLDSTRVAEGIETGIELRLLRDLGIPFGQGWFISRPAAAPVTEALAGASKTITSRELSVFPERRRSTQQRATPSTLLEDVPPVTAQSTNEESFARFSRDDSLFALAIVDSEQRPLRLVDRLQFIARYANPHFPEPYGCKGCLLLAKQAPRGVGLHVNIDDLAGMLTSDDQRQLTEGFIITEHGRYRGVGSSEQLVRRVTEARIEAAQHANPLTQHIERLLESGRECVAR